MNSFNISGRLGDKPKLSEDGKRATFSIAENVVYKNAEGEKVTKTNWFDLVAFDNNAKNLNAICEKGDYLNIYASVEPTSYESKEGSKVKTYNFRTNRFEKVSSTKETSQ